MSSDDASGLDVAVVGMSCRVPGAATLDEFWANLRAGRESIRFFTRDELAARGVAPSLHERPDYVPACGALDAVESFDAAFFGIGPREAELMDPQQRIFLECAWEALENAGYDPRSPRATVGVFASAALSSYLFQLGEDGNLYGSERGFQALMGNDKDFVATRVAFKLDLRGPAVVVQSACSSSLVAVHYAVQSILAGECDIALAGGVSIVLPQDRGYLHREGTVASPDGHCRPFDARGRGTVLGNGAGVVVLRRLSDALKDGDHVWAVVKGTAVNNDGGRKMSYTAPRAGGQADVVRQALLVAGVEASTIDYVEAHGTGTELGDPIEVAALRRVFAGASKEVVLGALKSNIGHLNTAAGIVGFIKTALALAHREIPGTVHFERPSPKLDLDGTPFRISGETIPWPRDRGPRRAAVSSFGIGGTNAHAVLEEAPATLAAPCAERAELLVLSARTEPALERARIRLAAAMESQAPSLRDVAFTLSAGRHAFAHRWAAVTGGVDRAVAQLRGAEAAGVVSGVRSEATPWLLYLFPGQGAQHAGMGRGLYSGEPCFRAAFDRCASRFRDRLGVDLVGAIFESPAGSESALEQTRLAQPALFSVTYALIETLRAAGVEPAAMIGHSIGELVAACTAGALELEPMIDLVSARAEAMSRAPSGAMLAVALSEEALRDRLGKAPALSIAAVNGPSACTVSGSAFAIDALAGRLREDRVPCQRLRVSHAFHSASMDEAALEVTRAARSLQFSVPARPYYSNLTGRLVEPSLVASPEYWGEQLRSTVRFWPSVEAALVRPSPFVLEVGPGNSLASLVRRGSKGALPVSSTMRHPSETSDDRARLLASAAELFVAGVPVHFEAWSGGGPVRRVPLPAYSFDRKVYWIDRRTDAPPPAGEKAFAPPPSASPPSPPRELEIAAIVRRAWSEALSQDTIHPADSFFALGGQSLVASEVAASLAASLGRDVPVRLLIEHPVFSEFVARLEQFVVEPGCALAPVAVDADAESRLSVTPGEAARGALPAPGACLVTGATGHLGAFVAAELLRESDRPVVCIVRAENDMAARERLVTALVSHGLWSPGFAERLTALAGDLTRERFGLEARRFEHLRDTITDVYHLAALVNFTFPYAAVKAANVDAVRAVIAFVATGRTKVLHHVSTCAVFETPSHAARDSVDEGAPAEHFEELRTGYQQSKWIADRLACAAIEAGLPATVYRPGSVWGHSESGASNLQDFTLRLVRSAAKLGVAPDYRASFQPAPVDFVARAIVALSGRREFVGQKFHLASPHHLDVRRVASLLEQLGRPVELAPPEEWLAQVRRAEGERGDQLGLSAFLPLLDGGYEPTIPRIVCERTSRALAELGVTCPEITPAMLRRYLDAFEPQGTTRSIPPAARPLAAAHRSQPPAPATRKKSMEATNRDETLWDMPFRLGLYDFWLPASFHESIADSIRALDIPAGGRVLDVGCGSGPALFHAAPWVRGGGRLMGVDVSPGGLAVARRRAERLGIQERVELVLGDMRELSRVVSGRFDAAFSHFALFALGSTTERLRTLTEVRDVLAPGGRFVVTVPGEGYTARKLASLGRIAEKRRRDVSLPVRLFRQWVAMSLLEVGTRRVVEPRFDSGQFHRYAPEELQRDLHRAGFGSVRVDAVPAIGAYRAVGMRA